MVYHIAGRLGSGKTLYAVNQMIEALTFTDKHIYTNIRLVDGWDWKYAKYRSKGYGTFLKFFLTPFSSIAEYRLWIAAEIAGRYHYISDLSEAVQVCMSLGEGRESSRLFIWDEIHTDLNARSWKSTNEKNIKFFSMSRKLGFDIFMISQLRSAVDRQMRELADVGFELKNLSNFRPFGIPIFPFKMGLLTKRWANKGFESGDNKTVFIGAGIVRYNSVIADLYNTLQIVTEKNAEQPYLWSKGKDRSLCARCAYKGHYVKYGKFIEMYAPENLQDELPNRLVGCLSGYTEVKEEGGSRGSL